jgi:DNA repair protein RadA/Sms
VVFGEVGLSGEIRAVGQIDARIKEASKIGFQRAVVPKTNADKAKGTAVCDITGVSSVDEFLEVIFQ